MGTILYHGSEYLIENPQFGKGSLHNDYGRGFYCTENIELAKEWACGKQTNGYANIYELDMSDLKCLNLNSKEYNILNWLAILADNRTYTDSTEETNPYPNTFVCFFLNVPPVSGFVQSCRSCSGKRKTRGP